MNQDKLKANKLSDRGLSTRKIFASSQVPPRSLVIPFVLLGFSVFFFYWFYNGLSLQQNNLNQINSRLIDIEESFQSQSNFAEERVGSILQDIKLLNSEVRKLWDLSNKRNKKNIALLENQVNEITEVTNSNLKDFELITGKLEKLNESMFELQGRIAKLSSLELNAGIYDQKFNNLNEAINAIDAYRLQINQRLLEIDRQLNSSNLNQEP
jgi:chromosome segregation ATPase